MICSYVPLFMTLNLQDIPESSDPFMNLATAQIKSTLIEKYRSSKYASRVKARIREISTIVSMILLPQVLKRFK